MTDELKKLQNAFDREAPVKADSNAKDAALHAAMIAFEEENSTRRQGNAVRFRLKEQGNKTGSTLPQFLTLSYWRKSMKLSYFLAGGTSIAVLTLAVFNAGQLQQTINPEFQTIGNTVNNKTDKAGKDQTRVPTEQAAPALPEKKPTVIKKNNIDPSYNTSAKTKAKPMAQRLKKLRELRSRQSANNLSNDKRTQYMFSRTPSINAPRRQEKRLTNKSVVSQGLYDGIIARPAPKKQQIMGFIGNSAPEPVMPPRFEEQNRNKFASASPNRLKLTEREPVSTFSIDVDTASYSFMRAAINRNVLPPKDSVRVEEMINYFPYDYPVPQSREVPFRTTVTVMPTPWNTHTKLVHIGIKGYDIAKQEKPHSNLVFLLDTSGSMHAANKLPLLKNAFKLLLSSLRPDDTISIVAYAGSAGTVLEPTKAGNIHKIYTALDRLQAGGSTAGGAGIELAYQLAQANFDKNGVNRVILATDGDFNVGIRDKNQLKGYIERKRKSGVFLSILGFGMGNYNDALMQTLAQNGNGNAAYIDNLAEARKVLVQEASSTLFTIAKDVKIQMEFNPQTVSAYRLIGYETRKLNREDFNNDKIDAGEIGAGHTVTAIYEITPVGGEQSPVDPLRYQKRKLARTDTNHSEYGFLKLRYKLPNEDKSKLIATPVKIENTLTGLAQAPLDVRFATAVAAYGQLLRGGQYTGTYSYDDVIKLALSARGKDEFGYRAEFINLVRLAASISQLQRSQGSVR